MNCLVVIDVQNDFVTGSLGTPEAVEMLPRLLEKRREVPQGHDALRSGQVDANDSLAQVLRRRRHGLGVLLPVGGLGTHAHHAEQNADVDARPLLAALAATF